MKKNYIKFRHAGLVTNDIKKSLFFYINVIGLKLIKKNQENSKNMQHILGKKFKFLNTYKLGLNKNVIIEVLDFQNKTKIKKIDQTGFTHIAISVRNIEKIYKKIIQNKFKALTKPSYSDDKKVKLFFCRTPEGAFLEIVETL